MLKEFIQAFVLSILVISPLLAQSRNDSIILGIFPYVSTGKLITHHAKLRRHLNRHLNNKLSFVTAKNMDFYFENVKIFQYDLIFTPPHLAWFAKDKLGYQPLAMTTHEVSGVFLVTKDAPYQTITDIEKTTISMVPEKALLHQMALWQLENNGLIAGKNVSINAVKTNNNAIYDLLMQESEVALTGNRMWHNLPEEKKQKLRPIAVTKPTAGFVVLAKPNLNPILLVQLREIFLSFNSAPENQPYIFEGFKRYDESAVNSLGIYSSIFE